MTKKLYKQASGEESTDWTFLESLKDKVIQIVKSNSTYKGKKGSHKGSGKTKGTKSTNHLNLVALTNIFFTLLWLHMKAKPLFIL